MKISDSRVANPSTDAAQVSSTSTSLHVVLDPEADPPLLVVRTELTIRIDLEKYINWFFFSERDINLAILK